MTKQPLVSIIIPCFNQGEYLRESLESVQNQSHSNWECIIVNDGSTDETDKIAKIWLDKDNRYIYIKQNNKGLSSARNTGLKAAKGKYIQFLDADDLLESNKISSQIKFFKTFPGQFDVAVGGYRYFNNSDTHKELRIFGPSNILPEVTILKEDKIDIVKLFATKNPMVISAPLYSKDVFDIAGQFDEQLGSLEDWDFHFRCATKGIVFHHTGYSPLTKTLIRLHSDSMLARQADLKIHMEKLKNKHHNNPTFRAVHCTHNNKNIINVIKLLTPPIIVIESKIIISKTKELLHKCRA